MLHALREADVEKSEKREEEVRPVQFIDFRLSCFVGQAVGILDFDMCRLHCKMKNSMVFSCLETCAKKHGNPLASVSSQLLPCVQPQALTLQKRVKELEARICVYSFLLNERHLAEAMALSRPLSWRHLFIFPRQPTRWDSIR